MQQSYLHPALVYMRQVDSVSLSHLVDFIYNGEVKMLHHLFPGILDLAQELGVKGLTNEKPPPETVSYPENKDFHLEKSNIFEEENSFGGKIEKREGRSC